MQIDGTGMVMIAIIAISGILLLGNSLGRLLDYFAELHRQKQELEMAKLGLIWNDDLERWVYGKGEEQPDKPNERELRTPVPPLAPEA